MKSKTHERYLNLVPSDIESWFLLERKNFKYCTVCGNKLDLPWSDIHLPYCQKCRENMINKIRFKKVKQ